MKILIVSLECVGSLGWYIKRALLKMGYQAELFDYRKIAYGHINFLQKHVCGRIAFKIFRNEAIKKMNIKLVNFAKSFSPDLIIVQKGEIIFPETIRRIKKILKAKIVVWHGDSPFSALTSSHNIIYSLSEYDVCFVFDPYYIPEMIRAGCKCAEYLPFACDPSVHKEVELTKEEKVIYGRDICFIGNYQGLQSKRTKILQSLSDFDLKIWGNGWKNLRDPNLSKYIVGRPAYGEEMVKIYNACKISININHEQSITGVNMRTFEAPACGCFLLTDELHELSSFYNINKEIVCYKNISDLRKKMKYYLKNSQRREEIVKNGQEKVRKNHTYIHRMEKLIKVTYNKMDDSHGY